MGKRKREKQGEEETKGRGDNREEENEWPRQFPAWPDYIQPSRNLLCTVYTAEHGCPPDVISCHVSSVRNIPSTSIDLVSFPTHLGVSPA